MNRAAVWRWVRPIWATCGLTATAFMWWSVQEHGAPREAFAASARVAVAATPYGRTFLPRDAVPGAPALVFLPGGMVDPDAYVPLVRAVAEGGVRAALVELPWRSAPTPAMEAALWSRIRTAAADITAGGGAFIAGHSRGGMFAAEFAARFPGELRGLILIGTTHPRDRDLSQGTWPVLKILGSQDCVASPADARGNAARLPAATRWVEITGGNHRQFAYYGWQIGDCGAAISREEQHRQTVAAMLAFLAPPT